MRVQVLDAASRDLADGYRFYERQAEGFGDYFLDSLWSDINSLRLFAGIHGKYYGYHRLLSSRFPFAIYYKIDDDMAMVRAVLDCRRDSEWISKRLQ